MVVSEPQDEVNLVGGPLGCKAHVEGSPLEALWRPVAKECGRPSRVGLLTVGSEEVSVPSAVDLCMAKAEEGSLLCSGEEGVYRATEARPWKVGVRRDLGRYKTWRNILDWDYGL